MTLSFLTAAVCLHQSPSLDGAMQTCVLPHLQVDWSGSIIDLNKGETSLLGSASRFDPSSHNDGLLTRERVSEEGIC